MFLSSGCVFTIFLTTHIADGNRTKSHKNMTFSVQAGCFRPHVLLRLILALNHTQYKISWTFSYKRRSKESFDHTHPCMLRFHIYRLTTVRQRTRMNIKYRSRAAQLENDETTKRIFLHPSECHNYKTYAV